MKYWLDTEFIEDGKTIDLLSIGIVAEDGAEFYAVSTDCKLRRANAWVKANVIPKLPPRNAEPPPYGSPERWRESRVWMNRRTIREELHRFVSLGLSADDKPEFWGYYADYDWVALCQLFGTMMDLPKGWPMYCRDIKQWADMLGNPQLPEQGKGEHNALADARWNRKAWEFLKEEAPVAGTTEAPIASPTE